MCLKLELICQFRKKDNNYLLTTLTDYLIKINFEKLFDTKIVKYIVLSPDGTRYFFPKYCTLRDTRASVMFSEVSYKFSSMFLLYNTLHI